VSEVVPPGGIRTVRIAGPEEDLTVQQRDQILERPAWRQQDVPFVERCLVRDPDGLPFDLYRDGSWAPHPDLVGALAGLEE
jgi:hypothetical protein